MSSSNASSGHHGSVIRREIPSISRFRDRAYGAHARSHRSVLDEAERPDHDRRSPTSEHTEEGPEERASDRAVREIAAEVARAIGLPAHEQDRRVTPAEGADDRAARGFTRALRDAGAARDDASPERTEGADPGAASGEHLAHAELPARPSEDEIRERAYQISLARDPARGDAAGDPVQDWLRAERELLDEYDHGRRY